MVEWKRTRITFKTTKLGDFIEPVKESVADKKSSSYNLVYGVTNTEGIVVTGKRTSKDVSNYIAIDKGCFAYNPYRINVGSIGFNNSGLKGCVSPAYVVFKTNADLNPDFLFLYLKSDFGHHLINWYGNKGGVRNALSYDNLCEIDIPAIGYQKQTQLVERVAKIQSIVSDIDSDISNQLLHLNNLRQSILQEAIEGKLTAKWRKEHLDLISGENHASKLLEKIKAEKERLIKGGKIKKDKSLPPISDDEKPFELPEGWVWCKLNQLVDLRRPITYGIVKMGDEPKHDGVYALRCSDVRFRYIDGASIRKVSNNISTKYSRTILSGGEILLNVRGTLGGCAITTKEHKGFNIAREVSLIVLHDRDMNHYILNVLTSPFFNYEIGKNLRGIAYKGLNLNLLSNFLIPLPPLDEQKAIVDRVDKIMAMIDELEVQIKDCKDQSEQLMQAVLREAFEGE